MKPFFWFLIYFCLKALKHRTYSLLFAIQHYLLGWIDKKEKNELFDNLETL